MAQSPVEFAVAFEKLRSRIATSAGSDDAVLSLIEFWPRLEQLGRSPAYSSYIAEYLAFLEASLRDGGYGDLTIDELKQLETISPAIGDDGELITNIRKQIARLCFYVGELYEGFQTCLRITNESFTLNSDLGLEANLSEIERFRILVDHLGDAAPDTKSILLQMLNDWQSEREFVSTGRIHSLLVQHSSVGNRPRGKLRVLTGSIEARGSHSTNDEITFDNQLRAADDPIVGVAYHALTALRSYFKATGYPKLGSQYYHAHLALAEREATYTGDSIGIATALLAYAQLLHTQALRHDHLLPGDIACTGGIDESGKITPVNDDSLPAKVERVFFSHIKYLVLPAANLAQAQQYLDTMLAKYPTRHLILLPVASLSTIVNDHNIVRPEKLCIGEFVAKSAVRYSRMTKVQVPMLAVLAYLLLCVIYPKAWVGFDWNPVYAFYDKSLNSVEVYNTDSTKLVSQPLECSAGAYAQPPTVCDINGDGLNEVMFTIASPEPCDQRGWLYCYSIQRKLVFHELTLNFKRFCAVTGMNQDTANGIIYDPGSVKVVRSSKEDLIIITEASQNAPARTHIRFWNNKADSIGWYVNKGGIQLITHFDIDGDSIPELFFLGYNNPMSCTALLVLKADLAEGTSPPYGGNHRSIKMGDQLAYVLFPPTDLGRFELETPYNHPDLVGVRVNSNGSFEVHVREGDPISRCPLIYRFDKNLRIDSVVPGDQFSKMRDRLISQGKLTRVDDSDYFEQLKGNVTYWMNGNWTTERELSMQGMK